MYIIIYHRVLTAWLAALLRLGPAVFLAQVLGALQCVKNTNAAGCEVRAGNGEVGWGWRVMFVYVCWLKKPYEYYIYIYEYIYIHITGYVFLHVKKHGHLKTEAQNGNLQDHRGSWGRSLTFRLTIPAKLVKESEKNLRREKIHKSKFGLPIFRPIVRFSSGFVE